MILGALMPWAGVQSSFKVPVWFLFDVRTTLTNPALGYFLLVGALLGVWFSIRPRTEGARVAIGALSFATILLYFAQASSAVHRVRFLFEGLVGWGPWFTLFGATALIASGLRAEWIGTRWRTTAAVSASLFIGTWLIVTFALNSGSAKHLADLFVPATNSQTSSENQAACRLVPQAAAASLFTSGATAADPKSFNGETSHCAWKTDSGTMPADHISRQLDVGVWPDSSGWARALQGGNSKPVTGVGQHAVLETPSPSRQILEFVSNGKLVVLEYDSEPTQPGRLDATNDSTALVALAQRIAPNV
jgi:hypothetical protein